MAEIKAAKEIKIREKEMLELKSKIKQRYSDYRISLNYFNDTINK